MYFQTVEMYTTFTVKWKGLTKFRCIQGRKMSNKGKSNKARFSADFTTSVQKGKTRSSMRLYLGMLLSGKHILETWIQQSYIKETTI